jgi:solute carrier family 13 (sodium-dependent dicarboxylate transporter), member 2/3/5
MGGDDIQALQWPVLWLVAGGIALGAGIGATGLDTWLIGLVAWDRLPLTLLIGLLVIVGLGCRPRSRTRRPPTCSCRSRSASRSGCRSMRPRSGSIVAIACSLAMALPISTPPNALAYATGEVDTRAMATSGLLIGTVGAALLVLVLPRLWSGLGLL